MATTEAVDTRTSSLADIGLLVLRIGLGATVAFMEGAGWRLPTVCAVMVSTAETLGGLGLLFGVLTPLAAFAVIAAMLDAWAANVSAGAFWSEPFNVPFLVAFGAATLLFTGAGAYSVDARVFGRTRWSPRLAGGLLILAIAAAILTWAVLNGTNPIHFTAPTS